MRKMYFSMRTKELFLDKQENTVEIFVDTTGEYDGKIHLIKIKEDKYPPVIGFYDNSIAVKERKKIEKFLKEINGENSGLIRKLKYQKNVNLNKLNILLSTEQLKQINPKEHKEYKKKLKNAIFKIYDEIIDNELKTNNDFKEFEFYNIDFKSMIYNILMKRGLKNFCFINSVGITDVFA